MLIAQHALGNVEGPMVLGPHDLREAQHLHSEMHLLLGSMDVMAGWAGVSEWGLVSEWME